jgi:hypothetical protein
MRLLRLKISDREKYILSILLRFDHFKLLLVS